MCFYNDLVREAVLLSEKVSGVTYPSKDGAGLELEQASAGPMA